AMESLPPKPDMPAGATYQREVLRIFADEYGAQNGQQDAIDLAAWFNRLRERALDKRLAPNEPVEVPPGFLANAIAMPSPLGGQGERAPTVVRR
ncbi:MAG TPA: hypothetical protein VGQ35_11890, partial [Dongiaceae bacterium]|nr:hypothetical protein [Dongiaceae bacterium]